MKKRRGWFGETVFEPDQQRKFNQMIEKRSGKILIPAGIVIMFFQIYNIIYTLYYTEFRLHTEPSRVYMGFYVFLMLFSGIMYLARVLLSRTEKDRSSLFLKMYQWYGVVLIVWAAGMNAYDQRVSDNLNVYGAAAIGVAALVYMRPVAAASGFLISEILLLLLMPVFQPGGMTEHYGSYVNSLVLMFTALFISIYRYETVRGDFQKQELIASQNKEIMQKSEALDYLANHDTLTGLWNRRFLEICLEGWVCQEDAGTFAVMMIDVDYFKQYNDTYGHQQGDECLQRISSAIRLVAGKATVFRYGGEEFLCMIPKAEEGEIRRLGKEVCQCVERLAIPAADPGRNVTVSAGWASGEMKSRESFEWLLEQADLALYRAKENGRNRAEGPEV